MIRKIARRSARRAVLSLSVLPLGLSPIGAAADAVDYQREVRPLLAKNCLACHGPDEGHREAGLRLDIREGMLAARSVRPAVVPGDPSASELIRRVTADEEERMPPSSHGRRLGPADVEVLTRWIAEGAPVTPHWSLVRPDRPSPPRIPEDRWTRSTIDRFVLRRLKERGLDPQPEADRATLLRRVSLDLTGLPPTVAEVRAFLTDECADAYERAVDRYLSDAAFGEHWARMWLDLARYADSAGYGSDPLRVIWPYRDWVIDAFNQNQPYDRFVIEQLAGDLLPSPTDAQRIATAFHRNTLTNTEGGTDDEEFRVAAVKDRASTTGQVFLGLTFGCAQCHSHKFDPISQRDFYRFFAFFNQTEDRDLASEAPRLFTLRRGAEDEASRLDREIADRQRVLDAGDEEQRERLRGWELAQHDLQRSWTPLAIRHLSSEGGAELTALDDGSILVGGDSPERDVTTVLADTDLTRVTALRLEVLDHDSLASGGPGREPGNGNVVLSDVRVFAAPRRSSPDRVGRYVRVDLPGEKRFLSLAEVEVFAHGRDDNVAVGGVATQSSVDYSGPPRLAIDGDTNGVHRDGSVTHTALDDDPWWEVDLGESLPVERVTLWNRIDGGWHGRLFGAVVRLLDEDRREVWSATLLDAGLEPVTFRVDGSPAPRLIDVASASFDDPDWSIQLAVDGDPAGDMGYGLNPSVDAPEIVLALHEPVAAPSGVRLRIELAQRFGSHHTLGRFRLSVTGVEGTPRALPGDVRAILAHDAATRSDEDRARLLEYYRGVDPLTLDATADLAALRARRQGLMVGTPVMVELPADRRRVTHVLSKGSFLDPGEAVDPGVPASLHPFPEDAPIDRLGLARWIVSRDNPLTARVAVNRLWARLFGRGIVFTEEDFGGQGALPTHPELLDWLAVEFMETDWDVKRLLKTIVLSSTYRQSSRVDPERLRLDPDNALLSRGPRFRLPAESVRDVTLAAAGLLSREMYGPSVFPPQPDGLWRAAFNGERTWRTSQGEDRYRRGVYTFLRRTIPYPALETFDATSRETCTIRRVRTNTPLQAFVTLNDPCFVEAAQALARRVVTEGGDDVESRARYALWRTRLSEPDDAMVGLIGDLFEREHEHFATHPEDAVRLATDPLGPLDEGQDATELAGWTAVANVLLNQDALLVKG